MQQEHTEQRVVEEDAHSDNGSNATAQTASSELVRVLEGVQIVVEDEEMTLDEIVGNRSMYVDTHALLMYTLGTLKQPVSSIVLKTKPLIFATKKKEKMIRLAKAVESHMARQEREMQDQRRITEELRLAFEDQRMAYEEQKRISEEMLKEMQEQRRKLDSKN